MQMASRRRMELLGQSYTRLLAENEKALGDLYECFAKAIPSARRFWRKLVKEEREHEAMVHEIEERQASGKMHFQRPDFVTSKIVESIGAVDDIHNLMKEEGISMQRALAEAIHFESGMIESGMMAIVDEDSSEGKHLLTSLTKATAKHHKRVEKEADRFKWKVLGHHVYHLPIADNNTCSAADKARQAQIIILESLITLEESISKLYIAYVDRIPAAAPFWSAMAAQEMQHADMLRKLLTNLDAGELFYNLGEFQTGSIEDEVDAVLNAEYEARHGDLTIHAALNTALAIERSLFESEFYTQVKSTAPAYQTIAARLTDLNKAHILELEAEVGRAIGKGAAAGRPLPPISDT